MLGAILTRTLQDLAATKTFFRLARYDRVEAEALQLSVEDVETGTNLQLLDSANLLVKERELSPYFVMEQLMFWDHQPQRKSDVLCFQGAVELPCPTNIMRCCMSVDGLPSDELQRIQELLAGRLIPHTRRIPSLKFAANLGDALFGCTALDLTIRQLQESPVLKDCTQLCHPVLTDSATANASSKSELDGNHTWFEADRILEEKEMHCDTCPKNKRKRQATIVMYRVRWRGNPPPSDSWEPRANLNDELFAQWSNEARRPPDDSIADFVVYSPNSALQPIAPAAPVYMFPYRSQDVGTCHEVVLYGVVNGHIYGTGIYTDDSDVATAALHAGFLNKGQTKKVKVFITGPRRTFSKSLNNGIQSHWFNYFAGSFTFDDQIVQDVRNSKAASRISGKDGVGSNKKLCPRQSEQQLAADDAGSADDDAVLIEVN